MSPAITDSRYLVTAGWEDVPHLDETAKRELLESTPRYLRDARSKGTPSLGAGAIYPFAVSDITVKPFAIPPYWKRAYGLDVGWRKTAAIWGAHDPAGDVWYLYTEHYMGEERPVIHAEAIKARGAWIPGVIDPAAQGRQQVDGEQLIQMYRQLGLKLNPAENSVNSGLWLCEQLFGIGRIKVFETCRNWINEYQFYRRDEKGKIVKENDHLMDAMRYLIVSGRQFAIAQPMQNTFGTTSFEAVDLNAGY